MELSQFLYLVPLVVGLVQVAKVAGLSSKYAPLVSVLLGVATATILSGVSAIAILGGVVLGLSASGLFSGVKSTVK